MAIGARLCVKVENLLDTSSVVASAPTTTTTKYPAPDTTTTKPPAPTVTPFTTLRLTPLTWLTQGPAAPQLPPEPTFSPRSYLSQCPKMAYSHPDELCMYVIPGGPGPPWFVHLGPCPNPDTLSICVRSKSVTSWYTK